MARELHGKKEYSHKGMRVENRAEGLERRKKYNGKNAPNAERIRRIRNTKPPNTPNLRLAHFLRHNYKERESRGIKQVPRAVAEAER